MIFTYRQVFADFYYSVHLDFVISFNSDFHLVCHPHTLHLIIPDSYFDDLGLYQMVLVLQFDLIMEFDLIMCRFDDLGLGFLYLAVELAQGEVVLSLGVVLQKILRGLQILP